jgi:hypothetical protein
MLKKLLSVLLLILSFTLDSSWGTNNTIDLDSNEEFFKKETSQVYEKEEIVVEEISSKQSECKILIISQGNIDLYRKSLPEVDPSRIFLIIEKKSYSSLKIEEYGSVNLVDDYFESGEVESEGFHLYQRSPYQIIIAPSESDILRAAYLRTLFGLKGQNYKSALAFRDKIQMKTVLKEAGVTVPKFMRACSALDVLSFIQDNGFPVLLKPSCGYGSVNTQVFKNKESAQHFLKESKIFNEFHKADFDVEEYIDAEMYHIDGIVRDGKLVVSWPSKFINPCLSMFEGKPTGSYLLDPDNSLVSDLNNYAKEVLKSLPTPENTGFHLELFYKEKKFIFCEIASRIGGSYINDLWIQGFDIDLKKEFIRAQAFLQPSKELVAKIPVKTIGRMLFPPREGKVIAFPKICDLQGVIQYVPNLEVGEVLSKPNSIFEPIASFVLTAKNEKEMKVQIQDVTKWFNEEFKLSQ